MPTETWSQECFSDLSWTEDIKLKSPNGYKGEFTYNQEYNLLGCTQPKVNQSTRMNKRASEIEYHKYQFWSVLSVLSILSVLSACPSCPSCPSCPPCPSCPSCPSCLNSSMFAYIYYKERLEHFCKLQLSCWVKCWVREWIEWIGWYPLDCYD